MVSVCDNFVTETILTMQQQRDAQQTNQLQSALQQQQPHTHTHTTRHNTTQHDTTKAAVASIEQIQSMHQVYKKNTHTHINTLAFGCVCVCVFVYKASQLHCE